MKLYKYILLFIVIGFGLTSQIHALEEETHQRELNEKDLQALRDFIKTKRLDDILEKSRHMTISGDIHFEWRNMNEKVCGVNLRGSDFLDDKGVPFSHNDFDVEFNLYIDYEHDRSWGAAQLQYDNAAGLDRNFCCGGSGGTPRNIIDVQERCGCDTPDRRRLFGSGECDDICLKRAYMGYTIYESECGEFFVEIGRRKLYDVFESDMQFLSRMDGIIFDSHVKLDWVDSFYGKVGGWLVDERTNHFAWGTEFGLMNLLDYHVDIKYSYVDWHKVGKDRCRVHNPDGAKYRNSQCTVTYHLDPKLLCRPTDIYGAVIYNHECNHNNEFEKGKGFAWYAGVMIGRVVKEGDWSVEIEYEWCQENAIPYDDNGGVGLGDLLADFCGGPGPTAGYKGWVINGLYAFTDNFTVETIVQWAKSNQCMQHSFSQFEIETVYAF